MGRRPLALERANVTRVANTMTVNPVAAALLAVFGGIWIATTVARPGPEAG